MNRLLMHDKALLPKTWSEMGRLWPSEMCCMLLHLKTAIQHAVSGPHPVLQGLRHPIAALSRSAGWPRSPAAVTRPRQPDGAEQGPATAGSPGGREKLVVTLRNQSLVSVEPYRTKPKRRVLGAMLGRMTIHCDLVQIESKEEWDTGT